jgi:F0F1-type ATP synthase alpha subunit
MDKVPVERIKEFQAQLTEYLTSSRPALLATIAVEKTLSDALAAELKSTAEQFGQLWK